MDSQDKLCFRTQTAGLDDSAAFQTISSSCSLKLYEGIQLLLPEINCQRHIKGLAIGNRYCLFCRRSTASPLWRRRGCKTDPRFQFILPRHKAFNRKRILARQFALILTYNPGADFR